MTDGSLSQHQAVHVEQALLQGQLHLARSLVYQWLQEFVKALPPQSSREQLRQPELWGALASVVERTSDQFLAELFWQAMDRVIPPHAGPAVADSPQTDSLQEDPLQASSMVLPLLGVPIVNRPDLLLALLASLDHPVATLAVVDNSRGSSAEQSVASVLSQLERQGYPGIGCITVARPFGNTGVAASWNLILRSFPSASVAMLINNDVKLAPGVLAQALKRLDPCAPQFLPLLPAPQEFSAFLLTARCWDRIGLFDPSFHPAYCEDLDYRDRLRADPSVLWPPATDLQASMAVENPLSSSTINSDPKLAAHNTASFALNRLWWLSHRRLRHDPRGTWLRQWLCEWKD